MQEPKVQFGTSDSADFGEMAWTFTMDDHFLVKAGRHAIMTENEFQRLLEAAKENLRLQAVAVDNVLLRNDNAQLREALTPLANASMAIERACLTSEDCQNAQRALYGDSNKTTKENQT